ncbi:cobD/Cbib family protein [Mycobacterium xenopi 4042]|uniref:CobD/Cbib family protein n=1 Tax=Mycobacterium xenopi 4042 TaxID=1299334 RepID=X8DC71_MYCXE|nr:cobD/Cbib family protein [Mycobacterium xenopi 4042]
MRRDPARLDAAGLTRAAVESVAENTSDAHVAPLLWAAIGGMPAVLTYRSINTLDSMIGHRSPRYSRFGWAAARLDDAVNYLGARATAALTVVCAPAVGGSPSGALRAWRRDARDIPAPMRGRGGGVRRGAGRAAGRSHALRLSTADPADVGEGRRRRGRSAPRGAAFAAGADGVSCRGGGMRRNRIQRRRP